MTKKSNTIDTASFSVSNTHPIIIIQERKNDEPPFCNFRQYLHSPNTPNRPCNNSTTFLALTPSKNLDSTFERINKSKRSRDYSSKLGEKEGAVHEWPAAGPFCSLARAQKLIASPGGFLDRVLFLSRAPYTGSTAKRLIRILTTFPAARFMLARRVSLERSQASCSESRADV